MTGAANSVRAVVAGGTAVAVALDVMSLPALYLAAFVLGMSEVVFDNTTQAILPAIVPRDRLERANGSMMGAQMVVADFVARPLSGALVCFAAGAFTGMMWNVVTVTLRQRLIPDELLGRVNSVYRFLGWGAMPIGTIVGGALVRVVEDAVNREVGLRAPFVAAAAVHLVLLVVVAPRLTTRALDDAGLSVPGA